ncbi:MAG: NUDIX domain-containing protein [Candidatus Moranbacteria bacterium]|nr:NUDIX domain-containing protein [Candidatus Moranbacteria bacterium]
MNKRLAVVIGRFQVPELHDGHRHLIDTALSENDAILILIGTTKALPSARNPLPFSVRERMIRETYPEAVILETRDQPSNRGWSEDIDQVVTSLFPNHSAVLYGSRDSFIPFYEGSFPTKFVPAIPAPSGTDIRAHLSESDTENHRFRAGLIHAQSLRPALSYQAIDIVPIRYSDMHVLLGRKRSDGDRYRFIGGFVDAADESLESAALRELREEAGEIRCESTRYLGSFRIPDERYRFEEDKVMTAFFAAEFVSGKEAAGDDLDEVRWIPAETVLSVILPGHLPLAKSLVSFLEETAD